MRESFGTVDPPEGKRGRGAGSVQELEARRQWEFVFLSQPGSQQGKGRLTWNSMSARDSSWRGGFL